MENNLWSRADLKKGEYARWLTYVTSDDVYYGKYDEIVDYLEMLTPVFEKSGIRILVERSFTDEFPCGGSSYYGKAIWMVWSNEVDGDYAIKLMRYLELVIESILNS